MGPEVDPRGSHRSDHVSSLALCVDETTATGGVTNEDAPPTTGAPASRSAPADFTSPKESRTILRLVHDPLTDARSLVESLRRRAAQDPGRRAFTFVDDAARTTHLTFAGLDQRARAIAARLQAEGARGERVLLILPSGLEFIAGFYACLYAGAHAVPAYPPDPRNLERSLPRLMAIVNDARPTVALTVSAFLPVLTAIKMMVRVAGVGARLPLPGRFSARTIEPIARTDARALSTLRWLPIDRVGDPEADRWRDPEVGGADVAYLQYTSGSTADPKGVVIRHDNAIANLRLAAELLGTDGREIAVGWVPLYHDLGLVCHVLSAAVAGTASVLHSPLEFLRRPVSWLESIARNRATFSAGPNFAFDLCVRKTSPAERAALDLSTWRVAGNGGEAVRPGTLERFAEAFAPSGFRARAFYPTLGLAEATLFVAAGKPAAEPRVVEVDAAELAVGRARPAIDGAPRLRFTSCGRTGLAHALAIVDPATDARVEDGEVGEIWFAGPSVPAEYWQKPDESRRVFHAELAGDPGRPYLRTGDLGFMVDGELVVTGRIKDLVIIRGRNYYPQDLEASAQAVSEALRGGCGAALSIDGPGGEALMLVQEVREGLPTRELAPLAAAVRAAIRADFELEVDRIVLVPARALPKTSSGKIQRRACRRALLDGNVDVLASFEREGGGSPG